MRGRARPPALPADAAGAGGGGRPRGSGEHAARPRRPRRRLRRRRQDAALQVRTEKLCSFFLLYSCRQFVGPLRSTLQSTVSCSLIFIFFFKFSFSGTRLISLPASFRIFNVETKYFMWISMFLSIAHEFLSQSCGPRPRGLRRDAAEPGQ